MREDIYRYAVCGRYSYLGERESLVRVDKRDQEGTEDEVYEDISLCEICKEVGDEGSLLLCDGMHGTCNAAYHLACVGLGKVPRGSWFCPDCIERGFDSDALGRRGRAAVSLDGVDGSNGEGAGSSSSVSRRASEEDSGAPDGDARVACSSSSTAQAQSPASLTGVVQSESPSGVHSVPQAPPSAPCGRGCAARSGADGGQAPQSGYLPPQLRLNTLACVSPAVDVPSFRPVRASSAASTSGSDGQGATSPVGSGLFANFAQRRRAARGGGTDASRTSAASFIKLEPTYEQDFMGGRVSQ
eukprot:TRINITY_DN8062_c0_g1_i1.p1 TRINITY_DN8062_c0_g1~~TRINITY_DN8062_c0_g1_i1.p1  ORF type:complete len:323 (-),score=38.88 TRINITY_DN8062_c0_g1_i1:5-904(-)